MKKDKLQWFTAAVQSGQEQALVMVETYAPNGATTRVAELHMRINTFPRSGSADQLRLFDHSGGVVEGQDADWIETSLKGSFPGATVDVKAISVDPTP